MSHHGPLAPAKGGLGTRSKWSGLLALLSIALAPAACSSPENWGKGWWQSADKPVSAVRPAAPVAYRYPDAPPVLDAEGLRAFVGRFKHRVVLLDFWASWSPRSRAEMAELASLQAQLAREGFQVISCNLDEPEKWNTHIVPALEQAGANYPCVVIRKDARPAARSWLTPNWSYDLPARFIIDRQGGVVAQATSSVSLASTREQVRRLVLAGGDTARSARLPASAVALRLKLVDVYAGEGRSIPEVTAHPPDPRRLAEQVVELIAAKIDRADNPRIAVLPFPSSRDRQQTGPLGQEIARHVLAALREHGYHDLVGAGRTQRMVDDAGITAMAIDFDPSVVKGRLGCDFLLIGWLRGNVAGFTTKPQSLAADGATDHTDSAPHTVVKGRAD